MKKNLLITYSINAVLVGVLLGILFFSVRYFPDSLQKTTKAILAIIGFFIYGEIKRKKLQETFKRYTLTKGSFIREFSLTIISMILLIGTIVSLFHILYFDGTTHFL